MNDWHFWLAAVAPTVNLIVLLVAAIRFSNRQEREWSQREERVIALEKDVASLRAKTDIIGTVSTQLIDVKAEMERMRADLKIELERVRNRLDRFLDGVGTPGAPGAPGAPGERGETGQRGQRGEKGGD
jgi:uncharacterized coiled-coil protein SlyX